MLADNKELQDMNVKINKKSTEEAMSEGKNTAAMTDLSKDV